MVELIGACVFVDDHWDRFQVISGRGLRTMTLSIRMDLQTSLYGANGSLGLFAILRG